MFCDDIPSEKSYVDDVIVKDELMIMDEPKYEAVTQDDPLADQTSASSHFVSSEADPPAIEAEPGSSVRNPDLVPSEDSYVDDVIVKDELMIKDEPKYEAVTQDDPLADQTSVSSHFVSTEADPPAIEAEPGSSVQSEKPIACDSFDNQTGQLGHLKSHMKTHPGEKPFACDSCDYRTADVSHMKRHKRIHTGEKPFACDSCDYRAGDITYLKRHKRTHTGEKPFACDSCDYRGGRRCDLKAHVRTHTGEKPFACDSCDYRTGHLSNPKRHKRTHTGEKPFACDSCDYRAGQRCHLKSHMRTHSSEKPFACDSCDYRAKDLRHLKRHKRNHTGEKPFACDSCDYRAGDLSHLKTHMMTHTGEKPIACDSCDFRARDLSHLKTHMRTHTGEKPFACDSCDYRAGQLSHLKTHMMTHTGEKPFACDTCDYRTGHLGGLKRHKVTHTEKEDEIFHPKKTSRTKPKMCPYCTKWQTHLSRHVIRLHPSQDVVKEVVAAKEANDTQGIKNAEHKIRTLGAKEYNTTKQVEEPLWVPRGTGEKGERFPCQHCSLLLRKSSFSKHEKTCRNRPSGVADSSLRPVKTRKRVQEGREQLINMTRMVATNEKVEPLKSQPSGSLVKVISSIRNAETRKFILQDVLLVDYGNILCRSVAADKLDPGGVIRRKLMTLADLCRLMNATNSSVTKSVDLIDTTHWELLTESIRKKAGWNEQLKRFRAASYVKTTGVDLSGLAKHTAGYAALKNDEDLLNQVRIWNKVKKYRYLKILGKSAEIDLKKKK